MLVLPQRFLRSRTVPRAGLAALVLAMAACGTDDPTSPVPVLAPRYRLIAVGSSMVPTVLDTTAQGERLLTAGTLEFVGATVGSSRPSAATRAFTFRSTEEENGVPRWVEGVQVQTSVRQSGRYVIFALPGADGGQPPTVLDSAIVDENGSLLLRAAPSALDPAARRYDLMFEPEPASAP